MNVEDCINAPSGEGPYATMWKDKPHRLVYDMAKEISRLQKKLMLRALMPMKYRRMEFNAELQKENDMLRERCGRMQVALEKLACLGNGNRPGNSEGNRIAIDVLRETVWK